MGAYEDFVNLELPRRSALLTYEITGYDGDPNDVSAPAILNFAPVGTWFFENTQKLYWRKYSSAAGDWKLLDTTLLQSFENIELYIRGFDGDDSNPGTEDSPFETLIGAAASLPSIINHTVIMHVGRHAGNGYTPPIFNNLQINENVWIIGDGGGEEGEDGFTEVVSSRSAEAGSSNTVIVTTGLSDAEFKGYGEHFGRTVEILSGAAEGDLRSVRNNTTTQIYVSIPFSAPIEEGDTFRIVESKINIYRIAPYNVLLNGIGFSSDKKINFVNFNVTSNVYGPKFQFYNSVLGMYGINFVKGATLDLTGSRLRAGVEEISYPTYSCPSSVSDLGVRLATSWSGWTVVNRGLVAGEQLIVQKGLLEGTFHAQGLSANASAEIAMWAGSVTGVTTTTLNSSQGAMISVYGGAFPQTMIGSSTIGASIYVYNGGRINFTAIGVNGIYIRGVIAIDVSQFGSVELYSAIASAIRIETSGIGIRLRQMATVWVQSNPPSMTCGGGDFSVNYGASTHSISALTVNSVFSSLPHGTIIR